MNLLIFFLIDFQTKIMIRIISLLLLIHVNDFLASKTSKIDNRCKIFQPNFITCYQVKLWNAGGCLLGYKFRIGNIETSWKTLVSGETTISEKFYPDRNTDYPTVAFVNARGCGGMHCFVPNSLKLVTVCHLKAKLHEEFTFKFTQKINNSLRLSLLIRLIK